MLLNKIMDYMNLCRICLSKNPEKDIMLSEHKEKPYAEIMLFCLDIKVEGDSKITKKLCLKCMKKLLAFQKFKSLALQNDVYLKTLDVKNESFIDVDKITVKEEVLTISDNSVEDTKIKEEPITELCLNLDHHDTGSNLESDDELLSVIKKIKYEYVEYDTKNNGENPKPKKTKQKKVKLKDGNVKQMCEECGKTVADLKTHSYLHLPKSERKRIQCQLCDKMFSTYSARYKHNKIKHLGIKKICDICNKAVNDLNHHKRIVHDKDSLPFECVECGRRYISKSTLELHMRGHTKDRPYQCDTCDKKFISKGLLQQHKRSVHDKEKSHLCQLCSKSFFKKYHLQSHLKSHSKERAYECPDCGKFYKTLSTLKGHRQTHGDIKNFSCDLCSQTFMKKDYLLVHMISHTKEKRYPCKYCEVKFHRSDHRKRHEYTAHQKHLIASPTPQAKYMIHSKTTDNR